ncbi:MAG: hypothetical protein L0I24_13075, partial [Pseudonocardia sp.]|nr:hypothetical protein [Pseudonocardia sp.]
MDRSTPARSPFLARAAFVSGGCSSRASRAAKDRVPLAVELGEHGGAGLGLEAGVVPGGERLGVAQPRLGRQCRETRGDPLAQHLGVPGRGEHLPERAQGVDDGLGALPVEQRAVGLQRAAQATGGYPELVDGVGLVTAHAQVLRGDPVGLRGDVAHQRRPSSVRRAARASSSSGGGVRRDAGLGPAQDLGGTAQGGDRDVVEGDLGENRAVDGQQPRDRAGRAGPTDRAHGTVAGGSAGQLVDLVGHRRGLGSGGRDRDPQPLVVVAVGKVEVPVRRAVAAPQ